MKNSNKWLLAALLVLLTSLTAYNMALRTEYRKGTYQDPLRDYITLNFKNFTAVAVPSANILSVRIVPGPFGVRVHPAAASFVHLKQKGKQLIISAVFPQDREYTRFSEAVVVSCPRLAALSTDGVYTLSGKLQIDSVFTEGRPIRVQGFRQDSLMLYSDRASRIQLTGNNLGYLRAVAGPGFGSGSSLKIDKNNHIQSADLDIRQHSELVLDKVAIPGLRYHLADSARITLSGAALSSLVRK